MSVSIRVCDLPPLQLGEGVRWDGDRGELLWVDILGRELLRGHVHAEGCPRDVRTALLDRHVGAVAPVAGGGFVLAAGQGFLRLEEDGTVSELAQPEAGNDAVRMNDAACDPQGRFWAGTMAYDNTPGAGTLYRLERDGSVATVLTGLTISNGIGWSPDGRTMYLADSGPGRIDAFAFDPDTGALSDRRTIVQAGEGEGVPDGLTVDDAGELWVAYHGGGAIRRHAPDGTLRETIELPATNVTCCAFGGPDRDVLFVTGARDGLDEEQLAREPAAGRLIRVDGLGATAPPVRPYRPH